MFGADRVGWAQQYQVIHQFLNVTDGAAPYAGVTVDGAGNLYGGVSLAA